MRLDVVGESTVPGYLIPSNLLPKVGPYTTDLPLGSLLPEYPVNIQPTSHRLSHRLKYFSSFVLDFLCRSSGTFGNDVSDISSEVQISFDLVPVVAVTKYLHSNFFPASIPGIHPEIAVPKPPKKNIVNHRT